MGLDLNVSPSFIMAYENVISDENTQSETRAKATGLLKKFKNYNYITMTCLYLDILQKIVPAAKVFEAERLLPFEVKASIQTTIADLTDYLDDDYDDIDSHIQQFFTKSNGKRIYPWKSLQQSTRKESEIGEPQACQNCLPFWYDTVKRRLCEGREGYQKSSHGKDHRDAKRTFPKFGWRDFFFDEMV